MYPSPILLAISGGVDSMVMLHLMLSEYDVKQIAVAHFNFRLRGEESDGDQRLVEEQCKQLGVQCYSRLGSATTYAKDHKITIQEAAREMRYDYFMELKASHGYAAVATAHHQSDSIETYLINMLRGSGPEGLSGIKEDEKRGIIRPLLNWTPNQIADYAEEHSVTWREDSSNSTSKYMRNRIRHELVPLLADIRPGFNKALMRNMEVQTMLAELLNSALVDYQDCAVERVHEGLRISLDGRAAEPLIITHLLKEYGFNRLQIQDLLDSKESGSQVFAGNQVLTRHKSVLQLSTRQPLESGPWLIHENLKCAHLPIGLVMEVLSAVPTELNQGAKTALIDSDRLRFPLTVRPWVAGDRLQPLGMSGMKKVSDLLNDIGLSVEEKKKVYVLESGQDIIWVIGHRIDDRYKVKPSNKTVLKVYI